MKRIIKIPITIIMMLMVVTSSVLTAFAANDGVQGVSYSYAEKGDCTVDYGDSIWVNEYYTYTHRFTVNGRIATCSCEDVCRRRHHRNISEKEKTVHEDDLRC